MQQEFSWITHAASSGMFSLKRNEIRYVDYTSMYLTKFKKKIIVFMLMHGEEKLDTLNQISFMILVVKFEKAILAKHN